MAKKKVAKKTTKNDTEAVALLRPDIRRFDVTVRGVSPLIMHRFSEKHKEQIEAKQQKRAKQAREKRDPKAEYLAACYVMPGSHAGKAGCKYAVKAAWFKCAAVRACAHADMQMSKTKGAFFIEDEDQGLMPLIFKGHPTMREDTVRLAGRAGVLDLRYRPEFREWSCELSIRYNAAVISAEQIINLLQVAGFSNGVGELRPQQGDGGGNNGLFEVLTNGSPKKKRTVKKAASRR